MLLCATAAALIAQDKKQDPFLTTVAELGAAYDKNFAQIRSLKAGVKMFKSSKTMDTSWFFKGTLYYKATEQDTMVLCEELLVGAGRNLRHLWKRSASTMLSLRMEDRRYTVQDLSNPAAAFFYQLFVTTPFSELEKLWEIRLTQIPTRMPPEDEAIPVPGDYDQDRPARPRGPQVFEVREARDRYVLTFLPRSDMLKRRINSVTAALHPRRFVWTTLAIDAVSYKADVHLYGFELDGDIPSEMFEPDLKGFKKEER